MSPPYLLNWRSFESYANEILKEGLSSPLLQPAAPVSSSKRPVQEQNPLPARPEGIDPSPDQKEEALRTLLPLQTALETPSPAQIPLSPVKGKPYKIAKTQGTEEEPALWPREGLFAIEQQPPKELYKKELPKPPTRAPERFQAPENKDLVPSAEYVLPKEYVGKPVTLDFKDVDVKDVFRVLADVSGTNIVVGEDVGGTITLYLRNVTWEKALDVVLQQKGLAMKRQNGVILISSWDALKQEDLKKPLNIEVVPIKYGNASDLAKKLANLKSRREDAYVGFDERTNALIIHDTPERIETIRGFLDRALDIETQQCLIESRIVQMRFDALKSIGIDWRVQTWNDRAHGNAFGSVFPHDMSSDSNISFSPQQQGAGQGLQGSLGRFGGSQMPNYQGGVFTFGLTDISNTVTVDAIIRALEQKNQAKLVSQPRIIVVNHTQGMIKQGVQLPVRNLSPETQNVYETQFKDANLLLEVLPHILPDGRVIMELHVTNDQPTYLSETGDYGIDKQEARSQMIVDDGQTAVIGGVFQLADQKNKGGIPLLSSLPVLGYAFKRHDFQKTTMELVIFITPRIIKTGGTL
jgi:type IV pilus assembly protein PilQ